MPGPMRFRPVALLRPRVFCEAQALDPILPRAPRLADASELHHFISHDSREEVLGEGKFIDRRPGGVSTCLPVIFVKQLDKLGRELREHTRLKSKSACFSPTLREVHQARPRKRSVGTSHVA